MRSVRFLVSRVPSRRFGLKTRIRKTLFVLALVVPVGCALSDTAHTGTLSADETWSLAGSPHRIQGGLKVQAKVTIEAGAAVMVEDQSDFTVTGPGSIWAVGTPDQPIRFTFAPRWEAFVVDAVVPSEFRYCHFFRGGTIRVKAPASLERPSHLFQHCLFCNDGGMAITRSPVRVLNSSVVARSSFAFFIDLSSSSAAEMPTIRHNAMRGGGIGLMLSSGSVDCGSEPFIQDNRIVDLTKSAIAISLGENSTISGLAISDCSLNCSSGIDVGYPYWGGASVNLTVQRCDLTSVSCSLQGYSSLSGTFAFTNNYWGVTNSASIAANVFGGALPSSAYTPFATNSFFRQADVDGSAFGNATGQEDAELVKQHLVGSRQLSPAQLKTADVDNDGDVDVRDALMIESFVKGSLWRLPVR